MCPFQKQFFLAAETGREHLTAVLTRSQEIDDVWVVTELTEDLQFPREVPVVVFGGIFWEESQELGSRPVIPLHKQLSPSAARDLRVHSATIRPGNIPRNQRDYSSGRTLSLCILWVVGAVLCIVGCLAASLIVTH